MSYEYRIKSDGEDEKPRCALRQLKEDYGFCGGARSCAECPLAKFHQDSQFKIEEGDTVQTSKQAHCTVESFERRNGYLSGYVWLNTGRSIVREPLSAITLKSKKQTLRMAA